MTPDYRAMCAELVELCTPVDSIPQLAERLQKLNALADRARALLAQPVAEGPTIPNAKLHYLELRPCEVKRLIEALDFAIGDTVTRPNTGNHHAVRAKLKRSIPNALPTPEATND